VSRKFSVRASKKSTSGFFERMCHEVDGAEPDPHAEVGQPEAVTH